MVEILIDSFKDTIKVAPLMFITFLLVDYLMLKVNNDNKLIEKLSKHDYLGGSLLGVIPQCGIPVAGLCANTGYGVLILMKELPLKKTIKIIILIQVISITVGELIYIFGVR